MKLAFKKKERVQGVQKSAGELQKLKMLRKLIPPKDFREHSPVVL